eukprot:COSAG01_NODE_11021_length_2025_cov_19.414313_2_plen_116_part_00
MADGGTKWGRHMWGVIEMHPPEGETILDTGKERLMMRSGGEGTRAFLCQAGPIIDYVLGVTYRLRATFVRVVDGLPRLSRGRGAEENAACCPCTPRQTASLGFQVAYVLSCRAPY